jgi:L-asparaginase
MKKNIYIAYTGGTIGMKPSERGYIPDIDFQERLEEKLPELKEASMPSYEIGVYAPLLDSSNMTPKEWKKIADDIQVRLDEEHYDGVVVLHGTDTMAYTASALAFMLEGLRKPVIVTGSQIPLCEIRNDARDNIVTSLLIASEHPVEEVCLYFNHNLLRGCRAVKINASGFDAFASPNYPPLGTVGVDFRIHVKQKYLFKYSGGRSSLEVHNLEGPQVGVLRLFPGISPRFVENALSELNGVVLQAYGVGNGPDQDKAFLRVLREADQRGVVIVDCTQCLQGNVNLAEYAAGSALADVGVVSGYDMTTEAATAKLFYLLNQGLSREEVKSLLQISLRGELSEPVDGINNRD